MATIERLAARLSDDERGLVIAPPIEMLGDGVFNSNADYPDFIRGALLLWDRLDCPDNNYFSAVVGDEFKILEDAGVLTRTVVRFSERLDARIPLIAAQRTAFLHLDEAQPGQWVLGKLPNAKILDEGDFAEGRGGLLKLFGAVPLPEREAPFEDILEFRFKRRAEMLALRHHIERIYQTVQGAADPALALRTETEALDRAITDHIRVIQESSMPFRLSGLELKFDFVGAAIGVLAAAALELPLTAALVGGAVKGVSVEASAGLKQRQKGGPFEYITHLHNGRF